ncbi:MAG TPA: HAMP domain-containing sensor histidine kinase [Rubrobacter sp.]|nr:HAMP domain-containing sensor histidine kinase [Rubrobacter sp.]
MPVRWRLTIFNALVMATILALLGVSVFLLVRDALLSGVEYTVRERAASVARTIEMGQSMSAADVDRLTLDGVFVVVRDREGKVLARTVDTGPAGGSGEPFWQAAVARGEPVDGQAEVSPGEIGYVYAVPVDPPDLGSLSRSPYLYKALARDRRGSTAEDSPVFGQAAIIRFPVEARVIEVGKSYEAAGDTVSTFAALLATAIFIALLISAGGAYLLARTALSPVEKVVASARGITAGDLSKRVPVQHPKDEIGGLAATINDLLGRLEAAFVRREEALAHQRRFVADASHQLRTPLTSIEGYARMLAEWGHEDPETAREGAETVHKEARHMKKLVQDLLSLAKGDEGAPLNPQVHDLDALAAEAVGASKLAVNGKQSVRHTPARGSVLASFDRERIQQAVAILVDNAVKYTPEGGEISVSTSGQNGLVRLEVSDTGMGIAREHIPYIFERFYRTDEARSMRGAGLGLSIARQIAEAHGGNLSVESEVGEGSTFALELPKDGPARFDEAPDIYPS